MILAFLPLFSASASSKVSTAHRLQQMYIGGWVDECVGEVNNKDDTIEGGLPSYPVCTCIMCMVPSTLYITDCKGKNGDISFMYTSLLIYYSHAHSITKQGRGHAMCVPAMHSAKFKLRGTILYYILDFGYTVLVRA